MEIEIDIEEFIKMNKWNKKESNVFRKSIDEELKRTETRRRLREKLDKKIKESW